MPEFTRALRERHHWGHHTNDDKRHAGAGQVEWLVGLPRPGKPCGRPLRVVLGFLMFS